MKTGLRVFGLFLIIALLYNWKILIGHQFSLLTGYEGANQAYAWYTFLARSLHSGGPLLWDPYSFSGHPFLEEMQNGAFGPLNLLLSLFPLSRGVFSQGLYHWLYWFVHGLAAFFMYLLARELRLSVFAGFLAGLGFGFGGVMAHCAGWPHLFQSFIFFPLIFLFVLRALKPGSNLRAALNAAVAGLCVALSILDGGLYSAIMQAVLIIAMSVFGAGQIRTAHGTALARCALVAGIAGLTAALGSAAQLLPSLSGGALMLRTVGAAMIPESQKIPYAYMSDGMWAHSFIGLFFAPLSFGGNFGSGEAVSPYMSVLASALALIGVWKRWSYPQVRFLAGLTIASVLYAMASHSLLEGVLYAIVPRLWMAREPSRALYLADFSLAVLCAYGTDALFSGPRASWQNMAKVLKWAALGSAAALALGALFPRAEMSPWVEFSLVLMLVTAALLWRVSQGGTTPGMKLLFAFVLLSDIYAFDWSATNLIQEQAKGTDENGPRLMNLHQAAEFLKSQPGLMQNTASDESPPQHWRHLRSRNDMGGGRDCCASVRSVPRSLRPLEYLLHNPARGSCGTGRHLLGRRREDIQERRRFSPRLGGTQRDRRTVRGSPHAGSARTLIQWP